jgi:hypothetical protein
MVGHEPYFSECEARRVPLALSKRRSVLPRLAQPDSVEVLFTSALFLAADVNPHTRIPESHIRGSCIHGPSLTCTLSYTHLQTLAFVLAAEAPSCACFRHAT